jgi:mannose-6-phosphate isomerase class I
LTRNPYFTVSEHQIPSGTFTQPTHRKALILGVLSGSLEVGGACHRTRVTAGQFCLVPACLLQFDLKAESSAQYLEAGPA